MRIASTHYPKWLMNGKRSTNLSVSRCRCGKSSTTGTTRCRYRMVKGTDLSPASDAPTTKILRLSKFYIFRAGNKTSTPANTEVPNCCCPKAKQSGSTVNTSKANRDLTAVRLEPIKRMRTGSPYAVPINRYPHRQKIASIVRKYTPPVWGQ